MRKAKSIDLICPSSEVKRESKLEKLFLFFAILGILIFPIVLLCCFRVVKHYKRAVILRFGRVRRDSPAGPGIIWHIPYTDSITLIDIRTQSFNLPPQPILTKDSVTVTVDAVVYFHIVKPIHCLLNVQFHRVSTELITIGILRYTVGQHTLTDALENREAIGIETKNEVDRFTSEYGVEIERLEIKDISLPFELQKAMAAEAESSRLAKAKVIESEGEIKTAASLCEAAALMQENPQVLRLRYLQTLHAIAAEQKTTVLFPFSFDMPDSNETRRTSNND